MVIFHSYVSLPEGRIFPKRRECFFHQNWKPFEIENHQTTEEIKGIKRQTSKAM